VASPWLLQDEQNDLFEALVALVLNLLLLVLAALLLWPLHRLPLALSLAKGSGMLWIVVCVVVVLVTRIQHLFRVNLYDHANAFVLSNLVVSCFLQAGWAAFAALAVRSVVPGLPVWGVTLLYLAGALSCLIAFFVVSSFFRGTLYKLVSLPLALAAFLVFSVWPASGHALYGWFFQLF
jgi:hypothetical protein